MRFGKFNLVATMLLSLSLNTFAQGVFEGSGEEPDNSCVGDGCGLVFPAQQEQMDQPTENSDDQSASASENFQSSNDAVAVDSSGKNGTKVPDAEYTHDDDEDDARDHYVSESASEYAARKEGFSKLLQFGIRAEGGLSFLFGTKSEDWGLGYEAGAGLIGRLPIYRRTLGLQMEFSYSFRHYSYEKSVSYGHNEAELAQTQFKIPVMLQYFFDDDGFYVNFGINLGLKMSGESTYHQTIFDDGKTIKDKHSNTLPTVGVDVGAIVDLGYMITSWMSVDLRVIQNFNNLLYADGIFESPVMGSKLYALRTTLGVAFFI
ncbi:MAG: PorT family protein [Fibrobacter sp.]|nr:PorT family protein [Fibrobacter sp.]